MQAVEVKELRSGDRWIVTVPLIGSFGAAEVTVINIAEQGVQFSHALPLRIAARARLWFKRGDIAVSVQAMVVWSRLSRTPDDEGKSLYYSGFRVEPEGDEFSRVVIALANEGLLRRDHDSLERKRQRLLERERTPKPMMKILRVEQEVPPDQLLLVRHARERLRANPDEAQKWYERGRIALAEEAVMAQAGSDRHDVLAVWEYLERTVALSTVARVFDA